MEIADFSKNDQNTPWRRVHPILGVSPIQFIFNALDGLYPSTFRRNFEGAGDSGSFAYENWVSSMISQLDFHKIRISELQSGLLRCAVLHPKFPPNAGEFILACRPAPNLESAFHEAVRGLAKRDMGEHFQYSTPAIYWASVELGFELRCMTYQQLAPRWKISLDYQISLGSWPPVPDSKPALGFEKQITAAGLKHAEQARQSFKQPDDVIDHLAWARKIVDRIKAGDKSVPLQAAKNAREALGL